MDILFFLIPIAIILLALIVWAFFWAIGSGQFDDMEGPAWRILDDDDEKATKESEKDEQRKNTE